MLPLPARPAPCTTVVWGGYGAGRAVETTLGARAGAGFRYTGDPHLTAHAHTLQLTRHTNRWCEKGSIHAVNHVPSQSAPRAHTS